MCPFFHSKTGLSISLRVFNPEKFFCTFLKATESEKMNRCVERCLRGKIFFVFSGMILLAVLPVRTGRRCWGSASTAGQAGPHSSRRPRRWRSGGQVTLETASTESMSSRIHNLHIIHKWAQGQLLGLSLTTSELSPQRRIWRYQQSSTQTCMRWGSLML